MSQSTSPLSPLVPASVRPARLHRELISRECLDGNPGSEEIVFWEFLACLETSKESSDDRKVSLHDHWLRNLGEGILERLGAGEDVPMENPFHPKRPAGVLRLHWDIPALSSDRIGGIGIVLEFLPTALEPAGLPFFEWKSHRFPFVARGLRDNKEELLVLFHARWVEESRPGRTLDPDDPLLYQAVVDNQETLVAAVLAQQDRIVLAEADVQRVTETALGVALENAGQFGPGAGFLAGCHRNYRDDDFCEAENAETWVPRALRIADRLRAAGAVDYIPLLEACSQGDLETVRTLLDSGYPPNFAVYGHITALVAAVSSGHLEVSRLLLERGANPNLPVPFSTSMIGGGEIYPLSCALSDGEMAVLLLEAGARPDLCGDDAERTPVIFRGRFGSAENAAAVFSRVDFSSVRSPFGAGGVFFLGSEDLAICRPFVGRADWNHHDHSGRTPLLDAIVSENSARALRLIELGADPGLHGVIWQLPLFGSDLLRDHLPLLATPIQAAFLSVNRKLLEALLAQGLLPDREAVFLRQELEMTVDEQVGLFDRLQRDAARLGIRETATDQVSVFRMPLIRTPENNGYQTLPSGACRVFLQHENALAAYPELLQSVDLVALAKDSGRYPGSILATFTTGRLLTAEEKTHHDREDAASGRAMIWFDPSDD